MQTARAYGTCEHIYIIIIIISIILAWQREHLKEIRKATNNGGNGTG
jgi:hypothetical protein